MDRNSDSNSPNGYNSYVGPQGYSPFETQFDSQMYEAPMLNPSMQYEQAYMYYRYLSQQMEYRIKCKEYEKLSNS